MSIVNYPNRIYKTVVPAIDRVMAKRNPKMVVGSSNVGSTALSQVVSVPSNWQLDSISFKFSDATSRDYGFSFMHGRKVVANYNDFLWFQMLGMAPQQITLAEGFYTGTQLAAQLKAQLDANTAYVAAGITFTVTYTNLTGLFVITPSSSTIKYLDINDAAMLSTRQSIAGHLFGLTTDSTTFGANVTTDTAVQGLDDEMDIVYNTGSTALTYYHDTMHTLFIDQAVHLKSSVAAVTIDWTVVYEEIV